MGRKVGRRFKRDVDYDTWENRHTEQDTSFEREVRQAIGELDDQGRACGPRCGGWQYIIRAHLLRCRPPEDLPPGTPEGPRLRPREGSKSEKTQCGACGKWRVYMRSHRNFCRGSDEVPPGAGQAGGEAAAPPPPQRPPEVRRRLRGKQPASNEEARRERGGASPERRAAGAAEEGGSGSRVHRGRVVHAQGSRGEIRQRAPRNYSRTTAESDTRSCTTTSTAAWAGERASPTAIRSSPSLCTDITARRLPTKFGVTS